MPVAAGIRVHSSVLVLAYMGVEPVPAPTVHGFIIGLVDPFVPVDFELIFVGGVLEHANLVIVVDEKAEALEIGLKDWVRRERMRQAAEHVVFNGCLSVRLTGDGEGTKPIDKWIILYA